MVQSKIYTSERLLPDYFNANSVLHLHRYAFAAELTKDKLVLDIASGEGYGSRILSKTSKKVFGVDIDIDAVQRATRKYSNETLQFIQGSITKIPFESESFDVVVSFETLEHIVEHEMAFTEIKRVLKKNGTLIISTPDRSVYRDALGYENEYHLKELNFREFQQLIDTFFSLRRFFFQKALFASVLMPETNSEQTDFYQGDFDGVKKTDWRPYQEFLIAVASDSSIPEVNNSIFDGDRVMFEMLANNDRAVKHSITYRVGRMILWIPSFLKRIFLYPKSN